MVIQFLLFLLSIYNVVVLARVLLSWFPNVDYSNPLIRLLYDLTEPPLRLIRQWLPPMSGMDFSPVVLLLGLQVVSRLLVSFN